MTKYSAAYWGTSFVREMTKLDTVEDLVSASISVPSPSASPSTPTSHTNGHIHLPVNIQEENNEILEELKGGQAELQVKKEDVKGSVVEEGSVPLTPPINAIAPSANSA